MYSDPNSYSKALRFLSQVCSSDGHLVDWNFDAAAAAVLRIEEGARMDTPVSHGGH